MMVSASAKFIDKPVNAGNVTSSKEGNDEKKYLHQYQESCFVVLNVCHKLTSLLRINNSKLSTIPCRFRQ